MKNSYKLLAVDIDGTIADKHGNISRTDIDALRNCSLNGYILSFSTGRSHNGSRHFLELLNIEGYHVFFNGAQIIDSRTDSDIYLQTIDRQILIRLLTQLQSENFAVELFSRDSVYIFRNDPLITIHTTLLKEQPVMISDDKRSTLDDILLVCLVITMDNESRLLSTLTDLDEYLKIESSIHPLHPDIRFINITSSGVNKGSALRFLSTHLGLARNELIAFGDGPNDIPLLEEAGLRIAMGNASHEVQKAANYVTDDVSHSGVAQAINKLLLP